MGVIYGNLQSDGYGDGYRSGYGSGYGYGYGYGDGYGYGSGYRYGYGDGYGDGHGDGSGYGYGYGYRYGYGDGYGDGSGYGYGSGYGDDNAYLKAVLNAQVGDRASQLKEQGAILAFWRSSKDGRPANGGSGPERKVGMIEEEPGPLVACRAGALHATLQPSKWKGERLWIVAMHPPFVHVDDDKIAGLKREIIAEIPNWFE